MRWILCLGLMSCYGVVAAQGQETLPRVLDDRLKLDLFAEQPQIVTPTGIDVDAAGRVWAIESNTHFPPEGYRGHPTDRVLVMDDTDGDHKADRITTFLDGLTHTMSVAVKPGWVGVERGELRVESQKGGKRNSNSSASGLSTLNSHLSTLFLATRREILLCTDTDGDQKCDSQTRLVHLETAGNYPHNGLAGFAFDPLGWMYFGFGENLGADYKIIGSDGTTLSGGGEGGNIYRCRPDGTKLEQWATGFWNPHANCFDAFGRLFSVDNDSDSRPPCRLLHIIQGGDYGYRFRNGRKGTHPFTAWNGEIPGTLPMVAGTGEAPSGIVCYESDGFPEDYQGTLLVGSWGDHRIDLFRLKPKGASFTSTLEPVVVGGENFRPVGLAVGPDGALYFTDWVLRDYKLHGKGRVWRLSAKEKSQRKQSPSPEVAMTSPVMTERRMAARQLAESGNGREFLLRTLNDLAADQRARIESLWALAQVPSTIETLNLMTSRGKLAPWTERYDAVLAAATPLIDSPQLPWQPPADNSAPLAEPVRDRALVTQILVGQTKYWLRTHNLSAVTYFASLQSGDPFLVTQTLREMRLVLDANALRESMTDPDRDSPDAAISSAHLILLARSLWPKDPSLASLGLRSRNAVARQLAVQWIGEEHLESLRPDIRRVLESEPMTRDLFLACLATLQMLDGKPASEFEKTPPTQYMLEIVNDARRSPVCAGRWRCSPPERRS